MKSMSEYDISFPRAITVTFVVLVIAAGVFVGIHEVVVRIDVSSAPSALQGFVFVVQRFFLSGPVAFVVGWIWNILGFARAAARARAKNTEIQYDINRFYSTVSYYMGGVAIAFIAMPEPWNWIGVAVTFFIDLLGSEIKHVFAI